MDPSTASASAESTKQCRGPLGPLDPNRSGHEKPARHLDNRLLVENPGHRPRKMPPEPARLPAPRAGSPILAIPAGLHPQYGRKGQVATRQKTHLSPVQAKYPAAPALAETPNHHQDQLDFPRAPQEPDHQASSHPPKLDWILEYPDRSLIKTRAPC